MRIIGGRARGRKLRRPQGLSLRPTPDRVREALFNILGSEVEGAAFLDLYAGTGAVGLEALSRGAATAVLVEKDPAHAGLCRDNLADSGLEGGRVLEMPAARALQRLGGQRARFDLIYAA